MVSFGEHFNQTGTSVWMHYCGGALVSENVVVTAAHCFFYEKKNCGNCGFNRLTQIRTGDQNFTDTTDNDLVIGTYEISSILKHPGYAGRGPKNDLAIVFTKTPIDFNAWTNPIALPSINDPIRDLNTNYSADFTGYGYFDDTLVASSALREAHFTIFTGSYCEAQFAYPPIQDHLVNTSILICAGTDVSWTRNPVYDDYWILHVHAFMQL